uniref:Uncharacterized protein n=1 Tax=Heliothis virescens TaxID=7102 RepID=A0A2A4K1V4_HELVI
MCYFTSVISHVVIMWNKIIIFALITVLQATSIKKLYGDWMMVAFYPFSSTDGKICIRYTFAKSPMPETCAYSDGRRATAVQITMTAEDGKLLEKYSMPMAVVKSATEVTPALNLGCKCGREQANDHVVARFVNENFFIMYHTLPPSSESASNKEQNAAYLFARNVVSERELVKVIKGVEDLKQRKGSIMCVAENIGVFKSGKHEL